MWLTILVLLARGSGSLFIFSGLSKVLSQSGFVHTLTALPFVPTWSRHLTVVTLPWMEVCVGSCLVMGLEESYSALLAVILLVLFSLVAGAAIARHSEVPCSCFGAVTRSTLSAGTVIKNVALLLLLIPLLVLKRSSPMSIDSLLSNHWQGSFAEMLLLLACPLCIAVVSLLVFSAQNVLESISAQ